MPTYEYRCAKCGEFEVTQRITDSPLKKCPTCRSKVTKLISNTSFQLKGSGWYVTDYGRAGSKGNTSKTEKSESESTNKSEAADTKASKSSDTKSSDSKGSDSKSADTKTSKAAAA